MEEQLPKWDAVGVEPPTILKTDGWQPGMKPAAQHMNWLFNRIYKCLEEIQAGGGTEEIRQELADLQAQVNTLGEEFDSAETESRTQIIGINNKIDEHLADDVRHVTSSDRTKWDGKQDALAVEQKRRIFIQSTAPTNPQENDIWIEV